MKLATTGGTSDARYFRLYCPVAELGLRNETAHMVMAALGIEENGAVVTRGLLISVPKT